MFATYLIANYLDPDFSAKLTIFHAYLVTLQLKRKRASESYMRRIIVLFLR